MALGIRSRLKSGIKRALGIEPDKGASGARSKVSPAAPVSSAPPSPVKSPTVAPTEAAAAPVEEAATSAAPVESEPVSEVEEPKSTENVTPAPAAGVSESAELTYEAVQELLDDMVRPALQADGGDISLIKVEDDNIYVKLVGACSTCPSSIATMKGGVELLLKEEFPTLKDVIQMESEASA